MIPPLVPCKPSKLNSAPPAARWASTLLAASVLLHAIPARADTQTWMGGGGAWSNPTGWSGTAWVPGNVAAFTTGSGTVTVGTQTAGGLLFSVGGYTLSSGTLTLNAGSSINTGTGTTIISATLAGSNGFFKDGDGTLSLTGSNTFTGGIFLDAGTLSINTGGNLGTAPASPTTQLTFAGNSTFQLGNNNLIANRLITINSGFTGTFDTGANTGSGVQGVISGAGGLTKIGAGTLTLAGTNTYGGGTTITAGTLQITSDANLGASGGTLTLNGGTLASAQTAGITLTRTVATGTTGGTIQLNNGAASNSANKITLGTTGQLTGSGAITVTNNGLLSIGAANAGYSGNWTLSGGVVELTNGAAAGTGSITVNTGAELTTLGSQITNALFLNGGRIGWDYYSGSGNYQGPVTLQSGGGIVSLVNFYGSGAINGTIAGNISGAGGLSTSDVGPSGTTAGGVLTLSGNNGYTGGTTVGLGTTIIVGSATALGAANNPLSVIGTLNFNGYSPTVGALTLTGGATFNYTLGAGTVERLTVASASLSGANDLAFNPANLSGTGIYNVLTATSGTLGGTLEFSGAENLTVPATTIIARNSSGAFYRLTLGSVGGSEQLTVFSDVPSKVLTIFPFGSSITAGQSAQSVYNGGGYRSQLYQDLVNDGRFTPNFVGSSTALLSNNSNEGNILTSANQLANEGHPGWTTLMMLANLGNMTDGNPGANGGKWLQVGNGENPNYITVNIGGNDAVDYGTSAASMAAATQRLDATVSQFNALRPGVATILSSIAYRGDNGGAYSVNGIDPFYNPAMQGVVFNHVLAGQNVSFLDLRNVISFATDISSDNIHPTQAGYNKMANAWYQAVAYGQAYWTGGQGSVWNTVNGAATNFSMDAARTTDRGRSLNDPAATTFLIYPDVYFNNNTAALNTTLGADTTVRSLNFTGGATGPVSIGAGNTLTIGTVDTSNGSGTAYTLQNTGGITVQAGSGAHTVAANLALGADQTWGNVSSNDLTVSGSIGGAHSLAFVGAYTVCTPGTYTANGTDYQNASYTTNASTVSGTGGFVLAGPNTYTGTTTVASGKLTLANPGSLSGTTVTAGTLQGTPSVTVTGGTLLLAANDTMSPSTSVALGGGTASLGNGVLQGRAATLGGAPGGSAASATGVGALTLTTGTGSTLSFLGTFGTVTFSGFGSGTGTLNVTGTNFGSSNGSVDGGNDRIVFATSLTTAQLSQITFNGATPAMQVELGTSVYYEVMPAVPEPSSWLMGAFTVAVCGHALRRRCRRQ